MLADLAGQPRGVVVSRGGFHDDARRYAEAHGIVLYELRAPRDEDWDGFITGVNITATLLVPKVHGVEFKTDPDWAESELKRCGMASLEELPHVKGKAGAIVIEREDGSPLTTVGDVIEQHLCPTDRGPPEWREHVFAEPAFIASGSPRMPRIRLRGLRASVELVVGDTRTIDVQLEAFVGLILKEVIGGGVSMFDSEGRPLAPNAPRPARTISARESDEDESRSSLNQLGASESEVVVLTNDKKPKDGPAVNVADSHLTNSQVAHTIYNVTHAAPPTGRRMLAGFPFETLAALPRPSWVQVISDRDDADSRLLGTDLEEHLRSLGWGVHAQFARHRDEEEIVIRTTGGGRNDPADPMGALARMFRQAGYIVLELPGGQANHVMIGPRRR